MLKQKIQTDLVAAMKEKDELTRTTLRMLKAAILNREKERRARVFKDEPGLSEEQLIVKSQLGDGEIIEVIFSEVKKRKEAALEFGKGKRADLADKEKKEEGILRRYLPEQISEEEITKLAEEAIKKTGAKEVREIGKVMAEVMPKVKGKTDGETVSRITKELLSSTKL